MSWFKENGLTYNFSESSVPSPFTTSSSTLPSLCASSVLDSSVTHNPVPNNDDPPPPSASLTPGKYKVRVEVDGRLVRKQNLYALIPGATCSSSPDGTFLCDVAIRVPH